MYEYIPFVFWTQNSHSIVQWGGRCSWVRDKALLNYKSSCEAWLGHRVLFSHRASFHRSKSIKGHQWIVCAELNLKNGRGLWIIPGTGFSNAASCFTCYGKWPWIINSIGLLAPSILFLFSNMYHWMLCCRSIMAWEVIPSSQLQLELHLLSQEEIKTWIIGNLPQVQYLRYAYRKWTA